MGKVTSVPEYLQDSQRTEDWFKQRIGKFTGSGIKKLMTTGRGKDCKWGDSAKEYARARFLAVSIRQPYRSTSCRG